MYPYPSDYEDGIKHFSDYDFVDEYDAECENIKHFQNEEYDDLQRKDEMAGIGHFSD